jgi:hypothetical protein
MDEPVPIRRAAVGCLLIALAGLAFALIVRPAIFTFAPERDDGAVIVATVAEVQAAAEPIQRDVVLTRAYGWDGEQAQDGGRVQLRVIIAPIRFGAMAVLSAVSPGPDGCALEVADARLADCAGRAWTLEGAPIEPPGEPPLQRFPSEVAGGNVTVDFTRLLEADPAP